MEASQDLPDRPTAKRFDLGTISKIEVSSPGTLVVSRGAPGSASISAIQEDLDRIEVKNEGDTLKINFKGGLILNRNPKDAVRYEVVANGFGELDLSGGISAEVVGLQAERAKIKMAHGSQLNLSQLQASTLEVELENGSQVTASGVAERQRVRVQDGSQYQAAGVDSREVDIEVHDGSEASIHVREQLKARAADGSKINYVGDNIGLDVKSDLGSAIRQLNTN